MTSLSTRYTNIVSVPAATMLGNSSGGESAADALTPSEARTLLELVPVVSAHPSGGTVYETQTKTMSVTASAIIGTLTYQWRKQANGAGSITEISGATASSYTTPILALSDNGNVYFCDVSNGLDTVRSSGATVAVIAAPALRHGRSTLAAAASSTATNTTWIPNRPIAQTGVLTNFKAYFNVIGAYKLKVLRPGATTWSEVYSGSFVATSGLNTLTASDFGLVSVQKGDYVGIFASTGRAAYGTTGPGTGYYYKFGDTTGSGNTMLYESTSLDFQMSFTVTGVPQTSTTVFDETFAGGALPANWGHNSGAWTYTGSKATSGTTAVVNSLNYNHDCGNLSSWTWSSEFTFNSSDARFCMLTRNFIQTINGSLFEVNLATGNMVVYHTSGQNGYSNAGGLAAYSTTSTGLTFAQATPYRMTLQKSFRTLTFSITEIATPANTYSLTLSMEDGTGTPGSGTLRGGFADGAPAVGAITGTVSVTRSTFTLTSAAPDWLFVGDSITEGSGVTSSTLSYSRLIATDLAATVATSCQGGATTGLAIRRLADVLMSLRPTKVHLLLGTNDTTSTGNSTAQWKINIAYIKDICEGLGITVSVGAIPAEAADNNPETDMNPWLVSQGWTLVRYDLALTSPSTGLAANRDATKYYDTLHPNSSGYSAMRDRFRLDLGV